MQFLIFISILSLITIIPYFIGHFMNKRLGINLFPWDDLFFIYISGLSVEVLVLSLLFMLLSLWILSGELAV